MNSSVNSSDNDRESRRHGLKPRTALAPQSGVVLAIQVALLAVLLNRPLALGMLVLLAASYWLRGGGLRHVAWVLGLGAMLTWSMVLTQGLFYNGVPRTVWLSLIAPETLPTLGGLELYREGILHGLVQSLRFDAVLLMGAGLLVRYDADALGGGLRALGLPAPLAFMFMLTLRFAPLLGGEARVALGSGPVRPAHCSNTPRQRKWSRWLGPGWLGPGWIGQVRLWGAALPGAVPALLASGVRKADEIAAALVSRGWSPHAPLAAPAAPRAECWLWVAGFVGLLALATAQGLTHLARAGILDLPALDRLYVFVREFL